jgi:hypothetical protein
LLRLLLPITKLVTGKQSVAVASEVLEAFGGAGYVEDTGLPALLRDSQVLPIWEGTTNVLSLDALLRTDLDRGVAALRERVERALATAREPRLLPPAQRVRDLLARVAEWLETTKDRTALQTGARRLALTIGRGLELALLIEHAQWSLDEEKSEIALVLARRFSRVPLEQIDAAPATESGALFDR